MSKRSLVLLLFMPVALEAQTRWTLTPYAATEAVLPGAPVLAGAALQRSPGVFGVRGGGGVAVQEGVAGWAADVDLTMSAARIGAVERAFGSWEPTLFVGAGAVGGRDALGEAAWQPVVNYGVGVERRLASWLALSGEARYRLPMRDGAPPPGMSEGWQLRAGLSFSWSSRRPPIPRATRPVLAGTAAAERAPVVAAPASPAPAQVAAVRRSVIDTGSEMLGTTYVWGGNDPRIGLDCSGFTQLVFARNGYALPRVSRQQATAGVAVPPFLDLLAPGDLVFFAGDGVRIDHVAIYVGDGRILHSSKSGGGVRYDDMRSGRGRWFLQRMVAARRIIPTGGDVTRLATVELDRLDGELKLLGEPDAEGYDPPDLAPETRASGSSGVSNR